VQKIEAVTPDDIQDIAESLFESSKSSLTVLGQIQDKTAYENILDPLTNS